MALGTITNISKTVQGNKRVYVFDIVGPTSYTTGGETLTPANVGLTSFDYVCGEPKGTSGDNLNFDYANNKLVIHAQDTGEQSGNLSTTTYRVRIAGR